MTVSSPVEDGQIAMVPPKCRVSEALDRMQAAVRRGDFEVAREIGSQAGLPLPLAAASPQLLVGPQVSQGTESTVHSGTYNGQPVAVKRPLISRTADLERFRCELRVMSQMNHPGIVRLLAANAVPPSYSLVMPWYPRVLDQELHVTGWRPGWPRAVALAGQLAAALAHVHERGVLHRDIKPGNVLLDAKRRTAVLTDFGIALPTAQVASVGADGRATAQVHRKPTGGFHKAQMVGTLEYMAPELLQKCPPSTSSDVYALAVTINELATGVVPFSDCTRDNPKAHTILEMGYGRQELSSAVCIEGLRPITADDTPARLSSLLDACWGLDPCDRPTAAQVAGELQGLLRELGGGDGDDGDCVDVGDRDVKDEGDKDEDCDGDGDEDSNGEVGARRAAAPEEGAEGGRGRDASGEKAGRGGAEAMEVDEEGCTAIAAGGSATRRSAPAEGVAARPPPRDDLQAEEWESPPWAQQWTPPLPPLSLQQQQQAAAKEVAAATACSDCKPSEDSEAQQGGGGPYRPVVLAGAFATPGLRGADKMEDRHVLHCPLGLGAGSRVTVGTVGNNNDGGNGGGGGTHLVAVFDGHRGEAAADHAAKRLRTHLAAAWTCGGNGSGVGGGGEREGDVGPEAALRAAFASLDFEFREEQDRKWSERVSRMGASAGRRPWPGATAVAALVWRDMVYVANAGDCRAVLCRAGKAVALSTDHTAALESERRRVQAAGGRVEWRVDGWRVGDSGMQVTRSLGDADLRRHGLTALPEVTSTRLGPDDEFLVLASDGLWDKITNDDVVALVHDTVKQPAMCAQRLVTEALARGSEDNVTAAVVMLRPFGTAESIFSGGKQKYSASASTYYGTRRGGMQYNAGGARDECQDTY